MAIVLPKFSSRRLPQRRSVAVRTEPAVGIRLLNLQPALEPNEELEFEYRIERVAPELIDRLEISIAWKTEGKGSEDLGVHFFRSATQEELGADVLASGQRLSARMPLTPLSYEGRLFKIRWCIRLRLFLNDGREIATEQPFYLGNLTTEV